MSEKYLDNCMDKILENVTYKPKSDLDPFKIDNNNLNLEEARLVTYITEAQILQLLKQKAVIIKK